MLWWQVKRFLINKNMCFSQQRKRYKGDLPLRQSRNPIYTLEAELYIYIYSACPKELKNATLSKDRIVIKYTSAWSDFELTRYLYLHIVCAYKICVCIWDNLQKRCSWYRIRFNCAKDFLPYTAQTVKETYTCMYVLERCVWKNCWACEV